MTVMVADRGANASVLAAAVAAMVGLAFAASVGLYLSAVNSQPALQPSHAAPVLKAPVIRIAPPARPISAPVAPPVQVAPHAEWMDRAIRANP
jgi:hypothetical protein